VRFAEDVERWDRFLPKLAEPDRFALQPRVRERLLATLPEGAPIGLFHGDFQVANLFFSFAGELLAVIDWELTGIGATLNDVGWLATFNTKVAWDETRGPMIPSGGFPSGDELIALYQDAWGAKLPDIAWFRALAAYKFSIIAGFNLGLHRRGKRHDPLWEITGLSIEPLLEHAAELLG
jgi:aminoglycoside phosphotransferase (APT) family kinase protein